MLRKAVFLDKDGTLVENVPYNVDPARVRLAPDASSLRRLQAAGYRLIVVTNQSGVARGYFTEAALHHLAGHLRERLAVEGVCLDGFYYCPHHPDGVLEPYARACDCRKPAPGLLFQAAQDQDLDLAASWLIGDILDDVEAAGRAGCRAVLLDSGGETEWRPGPWRQPVATVRSLSEAVDAILAEEPCHER